MLRTFLNVYDTYFKLTGILDKNTKALYAKTRLSDIAHAWYDSQGYSKKTVKFETINSYMLDYFIPSNYRKRAKKSLVTCRMR